MKTIKYISLRAAAVMLAAFCTANAASAQTIPDGYVNADWQVNVPISNGFSDKASGWGMNFEIGRFLPASDFALGLFFAYHTNNEYFSQQVINVGQNGSLFTDQQHSLFQMPFGVSARYRLTMGEGILDPYLSLKMGPQFARFRSEYAAWATYDNTWGFYFSPEIGTVIWPGMGHMFGFHLAAYYSYATNSTNMMSYKVDNLSNFGVRVGVQF